MRVVWVEREMPSDESALSVLWPPERYLVSIDRMAGRPHNHSSSSVSVQRLDDVPSVSSTSSRSIPRNPSRPFSSGHSPTFPRIIRANNSSPSASSGATAQSTSASRADIACSPPPSSPTRTRRPSAGPLNIRAPSLRRPGSHTHITVTSPHLALHQAPAAFPRPPYLEHSSLRHLLQTELPPNLPSSRYTQSTIYPFVPRHQHTSVTPAPIDDSDAESTTASPPPPGLPASPPTPAGVRPLNEAVTLVGSSPVFRLPTRWSEQDRHPYLSVSADGKELTYHG